MREEISKLIVRLPREAKSFVEAEASKYGSSMNSEIIRCVIERMERLATSSEMPAAAGN